ncbi:MAG TPA: hypothetical protein PLB89_11795 [Flavobacteriales bacterium]|nr:hypothetical protein [Flavobacteriales bacterium]
MRIPTLLLLVCTSYAHAQTSVLFIGNSYIYTNDLPYMFRQIALSFGETVNTTMQAPGGYTFAAHTVDAATQAAIASQQWDFVVLQEQSQLGALPTNETFSNIDATALAYDIQESSECGYPVFFMTWGRENGDAQNCAQFPAVCTYAGMQQALRDNYTQYALENEGYVSPVGWAWKQVRDTHPTIDLYQQDGSHPSVAGTYLAACVFYCTLFRESCVGSSFISTLGPEDAAILQAIASTTVLDDVDAWNLNEPGSTDAEYLSVSAESWNDITFFHFGQGEHLWTCSNGQTSTEQDPTFTFDAGGIYTFTHLYTDPCGHSDTHTWDIQVNDESIGINEYARATPRVRSSDAGLLAVSNARSGDLFELFDAQGRTIGSLRMTAVTSLLPCPSGPAVWRMTSANGERWNGKVIVP